MDELSRPGLDEVLAALAPFTAHTVAAATGIDPVTTTRSYMPRKDGVSLPSNSVPW